MEDIIDFELMGIDEEDIEQRKERNEVVQKVKELKEKRKAIDRQIKMLTEPGSTFTERAKLTKDGKKGNWQIAIFGKYYTQKREKNENYYDYHKREWNVCKERWIPIIQAKTEEGAKKELKSVIKALQELDKELSN